MRVQKSIAALGLVLVMALSLTACDDPKAEPSSAVNQSWEDTVANTIQTDHLTATQSVEEQSTETETEPVVTTEPSTEDLAEKRGTPEASEVIWLDGNPYLLYGHSKKLIAVEIRETPTSFVESIRILDYSGNVVGDYPYASIGSFNDGLARVAKLNVNSHHSGDQLWGFIDTNFQEVIPLKYEGAKGFDKGLAAVKKDGKWGYIDTQGNTVIPFQYSDASDEFHEGFAAVKKDGKWGYIDTQGNELIFGFDNAEMFWYGFAEVRIQSKYGLIDTNGNVVVPIEYDGIDFYSYGLCFVSKYGKRGCVDTSGRVVIPLEYDNDFRFYEGLAAVKKDGKWGFIDTTGRVVIPLEYDEAEDFSEGLAAVKKDGKWGFIDTTARVVIPLEYTDVLPFSEGLAAVVDMDLKDIKEPKDAKMGFIDSQGQMVIQPENQIAYSFSGGLARVDRWLEGEWVSGYIDAQGHPIFLENVLRIEDHVLKCDVFFIQKDNHWGFCTVTWN